MYAPDRTPDFGCSRPTTVLVHAHLLLRNNRLSRYVQ
jgi:hypothetical protein